MIINSSSILNNSYRCNKRVMEYLVKSGLPVLSYDNKYFYFANTDLLKNALKTMPLYLKILDGFSGKGGQM